MNVKLYKMHEYMNKHEYLIKICHHSYGFDLMQCDCGLLCWMNGSGAKESVNNSWDDAMHPSTTWAKEFQAPDIVLAVKNHFDLKLERVTDDKPKDI